MAILKFTDLTVGLRVTEEHEELGLDASQHGEVAYRV
jgi:Amt family ammonium transporter